MCTHRLISQLNNILAGLFITSRKTLYLSIISELDETAVARSDLQSGAMCICRTIYLSHCKNINPSLSRKMLKIARKVISKGQLPRKILFFSTAAF